MMREIYISEKTWAQLGLLAEAQNKSMDKMWPKNSPHKIMDAAGTATCILSEEVQNKMAEAVEKCVEARAEKPVGVADPADTHEDLERWDGINPGDGQ